MNLNLTCMTLTISLLFGFIANATVASDTPKQSLKTVKYDTEQIPEKLSAAYFLMLYEKTKDPECLRTVQALMKSQETLMKEEGKNQRSDDKSITTLIVTACATVGSIIIARIIKSAVCASAGTTRLHVIFQVQRQNNQNNNGAN